MNRNTSTLCCLLLLLCLVLEGHVHLTLAPLAHARAVDSRPDSKPNTTDTTPKTTESPKKRAGHKAQATAGSSIPVTVTVVNLTTGDEPVLPNSFFLDQNYPNPFNAATVIAYGVPEAAHVRIEVYNVLAQRVVTLADGVHAPGRYEATWDPKGLASGVYFYRMIAGSFRRTRHMIQLK